MSSHTMTLALPEDLYRTVSTLAQVTKRPLAEILQDSLAHTLPPLDDVPAKEAAVLAHMSTLDDAALWHASRVTMPESQQEAFHCRDKSLVLGCCQALLSLGQHVGQGAGAERRDCQTSSRQDATVDDACSVRWHGHITSALKSEPVYLPVIHAPHDILLYAMAPVGCALVMQIVGRAVQLWALGGEPQDG